MSEQLRLMAVHAHPDDESSKGAATMARYVREGVDVLVVTCTGGERGDILNPKLAGDPEILANMAQIRRAEMERAREILGVRQEWLGFVDSGWLEDYRPEHADKLPDGCFGREDVATAAQPLIKLMREFRPHVVITYDEEGGYPHPDHIQCHRVSVAAFDAAGDAQVHPELGEAWQPLKLYYHVSFTRSQFTALHEACLAAGIDSPYAELLADWPADRDKGDRVTTRVECGAYFPIRDDALRAHATQIDPDGGWFRAPLAIRQQGWPTEDYQLAKSLVDSPTPESDLFAGIRKEGLV
ncbi:MAG: mycothiol conjugate amidase Mca [Hamadaea sp.]|nr:mycothiol conjugate amidase Mca [Hamadaea sp.]NUR51111.1 mycothiol conjugate amidase Mca [Hamadaea sp.]NUT05535.1 mycothiol conjugate amidase Mca [Hamadaea sp.]